MNHINTKTDFTLVNQEIIKSDKTNIVENDIFLRQIFREILEEACPIVVAFQGNPATVNGNKWFGHPWSNIAPSLKLIPNYNNYFSLAIFKPDETGKYRRKKMHFMGLYAVMLDDIGTKIATERLTLQPSWLLETSQGNYQAGYLLEKPITDSKLADQMYRDTLE